MAGAPIRVAPQDGPAPADSMNPDHLAVSVEPDAAWILFYDEKDLTPAAICHELLHIQRFWLEQIPLIFTPPLTDFTGTIECGHGILDNALEHLTIIPMEAERGYSRLDYWHRTLELFWQRLTTWDREDPRSVRQNALIGYTGVKALFPTSDLLSRITEELSRLPIEADSMYRFDSVLAARSDKRLQVALAMAYIGFLPPEWGLKYLDPKARSQRVEPGTSPPAV